MSSVVSRSVLVAAVGKLGSASWPKATKGDLTGPLVADPCAKRI